MTLSKQLDALQARGMERERLTSQLAEVVGKVCDTIADTVQPGTEVVVPGMPGQLNLAVYRFSSNIGSEAYLCSLEIPPDCDECYTYVVTAGETPGGSFYLHGDFGVQLNVASRATYLAIANRLPEVVEAFDAEETKIVDALREAFESLLKLSGK